ncbi:MAG: 2-C-methyl-D-erythritol 4-phosphate cytidylyltransferase [Pseudomonadota bacterium]
MSESRVWVVVPAAGIGSRMGADRPKQYLEFAGSTILQCTLERLHRALPDSLITVALGGDDPWWSETERRLPESLLQRLHKVEGGEERCHSVLNALDSLTDQAAADDWILVHDAARPCVRPGDIAHLIASAEERGHGGLLASPVKDTMKRADDSGCVGETVERKNLWHALTPQLFPRETLHTALSEGLARGLAITDEAMAVEAAGGRVALVEGHADNIKITHPGDLALASLYWRAQASEDDSEAGSSQ